MQVLDRYLEEMKGNSSLNEDQLVNICQDLFAAGSETVSSTLAFSLQYLVMNPDVQEKCHLVVMEKAEENVIANLQNMNKCEKVNKMVGVVCLVFPIWWPRSTKFGASPAWLPPSFPTGH